MNYYSSFVDSLKNGKAAPVYLFYGKEVFLQKRAVNKLKEAILEQGTSEFNMVVMDGNEIPMDQVISLAGTFPFMAQKRLVVVKDAPIFRNSRKIAGGAGSVQSGKKAENLNKEEQELLKYLDNPAPFTCLVFVIQDSPDKRKKVFKRLLEMGMAIDFKTLGHEDILSWLAYEARSAGKRLDVKAGNELMARAGTSLNILENELAKVINYAGSKEKITVKEVRSVVSGSLESSVFDMVDALGEGNYVEALNRIKDLLLNKQPPQLILSLIARQFRLILAFAHPPNRALSQKEVEKQLKIHPYVARKIRRQSRNFNQDIAEYALKKLLEVDIAVKTGKQDFYPAIETMVVNIAQLTRK